MDRKSWKYRKRSGAIKRKVLKEYLAITNQTINDEESNKCDNITLQNNVVKKPKSGQELASKVEDSVYSESVNTQYSDSSQQNQSILESSSTSEVELALCSEFIKNVSFREEIKDWAIEKNISQEALKNLATILNKRFPNILPNDPRTILRTPREINLKLFEQGEYWHNGLIHQLEIILDNCIDLPNYIYLNINFDGLPIFKSSKKEFWPILCQVFELTAPPFVVGIYCGVGKPNVNRFLEDFIKEMRKVVEDGIRNVKIKIRCIMCDSPARAFIKGVCNFNGKHGCLKCVTTGEYSHKSHTVVFPEMKCPERTDDGFRKKLYGLHHKFDSPLLQLPIDMVLDIPVTDSLHLIDLGLMKRLLVGWRDGNFGKRITKWCAKDIDFVTYFLKQRKLPSEIHRSVRGLDCLAHWKASEYRSFLYYLSIIILPEVLGQNAFTHFLTLYCGIIICSHESYKYLLPLAKELLESFVERFKDFYGADYVTSNVHNILHVVDEVHRFGPLQSFNAYPFENKLYLIKLMLRNGNKPLTQVAKRLSEDTRQKAIISSSDQIHPFVIKRLKKKHTAIQFKNFIISTKPQDKYIMSTNHDVIEIKKISGTSNSDIHIHGFKITGLTDIFKYPVKSSTLNLFKSNLPIDVHTNITLGPQDVKFKLVCSEYKNQLYLIPLLHTL